MQNKQDLTTLWSVAFSTVQELETADGITASGKDEIYGCVFGRDCLITSIKLLKVYETTHNQYFIQLVRKVLLGLSKLQGKEINIESGEQPGKCIHEFRPEKHEHLTKNLESPWHVYPDGSMKNYDTVDATPLFLVAVAKFYNLTSDEEFLKQILPSVELSLFWMLDYGDSNKDGFIDYEFHKNRKYGGLKTQSWMDSEESVFHEDDTDVCFPVAPVEVQAYSYTALRSWEKYFKEIDPSFSEKISTFAEKLKQNFNEKFVVDTPNSFHIAFAIDNNQKTLLSARSSIGHILWLSLDTEDEKEIILDKKYIPKLVDRILKEDLFEKEAGIRTLGKNSKQFKANSYHNGSIWPHDTSIIISGLENFGFTDEATRVRSAILSAYSHYQTPIELFVYDKDGYKDYIGSNGQTACKKQAWSAAGLLASLSSLVSIYEISESREEIAQS